MYQRLKICQYASVEIHAFIYLHVFIKSELIHTNMEMKLLLRIYSLIYIIIFLQLFIFRFFYEFSHFLFFVIIENGIESYPLLQDAIPVQLLLGRTLRGLRSKYKQWVAIQSKLSFVPTTTDKADQNGWKGNSLQIMCSLCGVKFLKPAVRIKKC